MNDNELFELCREYGRRARKWKNKFVALLPEVFRRRLYRKRGFCSIYEFAAKLAGISKNVVDEALRLDSKFEKMPELKKLIPEVGLSKLRIVAGVAKKETDLFWANKVQEMTRSALSSYLKELYPGIEEGGNTNLSLFDEQSWQSESRNLKAQNVNKSTFSMQLSEESIIKLRLLKQKFEKQQKQVLCWDEVVQLATEELLNEPKVRTVEQRPYSSRNIPAQLRREQSKVCEHPGCNRPAEVIHHKNRWAITKKHENLKALCKAHHELEHQTDIVVDQKFRRFKMQVRAGFASTHPG